ncbi:MAG: sigma-70 family RNA polymerase sigma factor [Phycisphaerae bacterium]|nr:sigma-70 family RNA polymerase sigma factor [Saprospiraceae bacterium]
MSQATPWTDQAIVSAIAGGGTGRDLALQWWFGNEGLQRWVRHYATQHGGSEADGEDLYHDAFITFDRLLREGKYREESTLKTFFCSIAKWQWLNRQRKQGRIVAMDKNEQPEIAQFTDDEMYDQERQAVFQKMLASLGDKCKRLLSLYQLSYSMKEIAAEMAYASDQVAMNQCSECRKKLKALIENSHELKDFFNI